MTDDTPHISYPDLLPTVVEALIFASDEPLSARTIAQILRDEFGTLPGEQPALFDTPETAVQEEAVPEESEVQPEEAETSDEGEGAQEVERTTNDLAEAAEDLSRRRTRAPQRTLEPRTITATVRRLNSEYEEGGRAFRIIELAGGYIFATTRDVGEYVALLSKQNQRRRLSAAALETLSIIAYRQPVSKPEVELIRGVGCDQVLANLMEKNLVAIVGRGEGVGRPLLYGTTDDFLRTFGLRALGDLPKLREIEELMEQNVLVPVPADVVTVDRDSNAEEIEAQVGAAGHAHHEQERNSAESDHEEMGNAESADASTPESEAVPDSPKDPADEPRSGNATEQTVDASTH